jgi:hypothetical protein
MAEAMTVIWKIYLRAFWDFRHTRKRKQRLENSIGEAYENETQASHIFVAVLLTFALLSANAVEPVNDSKTTEELAKESQNPIANLISVPFQNNFNFGVGPNDATQGSKMVRALSSPKSLSYFGMGGGNGPGIARAQRFQTGAGSND